MNRLLLGIGFTVLLASSLVAGTLVLGPAVGDVRLPWGGGVQGDDPGAANIADINETDRHRYVNTTFEFQCWADWCRPESGPLVFRIQQESRGDFQWEGLYTVGFEDNKEVRVALFRGQTYRLLVKHPDGRILMLGNYTATEPADVEVSLTVEDGW